MYQKQILFVVFKLKTPICFLLQPCIVEDVADFKRHLGSSKQNARVFRPQVSAPREDCGDGGIRFEVGQPLLRPEQGVPPDAFQAVAQPGHAHHRPLGMFVITVDPA